MILCIDYVLQMRLNWSKNCYLILHCVCGQGRGSGGRVVEAMKIESIWSAELCLFSIRIMLFDPLNFFSVHFALEFSFQFGRFSLFLCEIHAHSNISTSTHTQLLSYQLEHHPTFADSHWFAILLNFSLYTFDSLFVWLLFAKFILYTAQPLQYKKQNHTRPH